MRPTKKKIEKQLPENIINPFSESFLDKWKIWKEYKFQEFKFQYKGVISEQAALMGLNNISGGNEDIACQIIDQSIKNGWKGLFMLKNDTNGTHKQIFGGEKLGTSAARVEALKKW